MNNSQQTLNFEFEETKKERGPVTVLGRTFANDEERRRVFRDELRAKLPELRQIEGFPIGEDDDIINLSDPPYYTACPNPWLNDFIAQWEQEKEQLKAEGRRVEDFEVKEPYASDVSEGKNNPIYNAHSYHTKVPHPAIMRYLLHYTQPGDIVFDGFCGTGMTGVATNFISQDFTEDDIKKGYGTRHAILSNLSPVASLISANYNTIHSIKELDVIGSAISQVEDELGFLYKTNHTIPNIKGNINYVVWSDVFICPNCGHKIVFYNAAVDENTGKVHDVFKCDNCNSNVTKKNAVASLITTYDSILKQSVEFQEKVPVLINYLVGNKSYTKKPDEYDIENIQKAELMVQQCTRVIQRMTEGREARRNDKHGFTHVHHFYFPRTLLVLSRLFELSKSKEFLFLLNSQLINISKLNRYRPCVSFPYNPLSGTLYIGSQISEANPFIAYKNKLKKLSIAFNLITSNNVTSISSATSTNIPSCSIDYIFTDPPFGANISYSELNFIQEAWLKVITNNKEEAIENVSLGKNLNDYQDLMEASLREYYRILKPGKWLTIEFSNTSAAIWNAILQAIQNAGFVITNTAALDKQQGSFKAVTTTTAVKQDLIISCFKPTENLTGKFEHSADTSDNVWDFISELLEHLPVHIERERKTTTVVERSPKILYDRLIAYYVQYGYPIPLDAQEFQQGLKERFVMRDGMFFNAEQAVEYDQKKHDAPDLEGFSLFVDSEQSGIHWLKNELKDKPQTYQDVQPKWMQAMANPRKGDRVPELMDILKENFLEDESGYWRLPDPEKEADLEKIRTKKLLREFDHYVEHANLAKSKKLKDARLEALRVGFKDCYQKKEFATIIKVGDKIPESLLTEDEVLLQYYDIATTRV